MKGESERRRASGFVCVRGDGALLLLRDARAGHWGIPKGYQDPADASRFACGRREAREELGPISLLVVAGYRREIEYQVRARGGWPEHPKSLLCYLALWPEGRCPQLSHEHDRWRFVQPSELADYVPYPELRGLLEEAVRVARRHLEQREP